ncbi:protein INCA1 isoform X3 [Apodemus sylvaticus]|uniref:protein INCA1 isoform X3 n=1 Tax=Apodemus sylvaticus TaxID=10129 RepID=UPI002241D095|nr:protein INCA1 isoform X3 [Apodemus sylvaticus]
MQGQEDGDSILPFAKCSRVVSRFSPSSLRSQNSRPMPQPYGDTFWENLSQRSSSNWMVEQYIPPILGLPPPEKLWRRKRKKLHLETMQKGPGSVPARVRAVTYHLEDLRRRQGVINELKKAQWGSSDATPELPVLEEGCELLSPTQYFDVEEERATYPQEETYFVTPRDQLLWSPWTPVGQQGTYASGQLSSLAHSTVTARKNPIYNPQRMELESEE